VKLQRPILVGGLGLSFALWLFDSLQDSFVQLSEFSLLGLVAVGGSLWLFKQRGVSNELLQCELPNDRATVEKAILKASAVISQLAGADESDVETKNFAILLQKQISKLENEIDRQEIQLAVTGGKSVGKSTLINTLQQNASLLPSLLGYKETAPLFVADNSADDEVLNQTVTSDYVLFLVNGDITDTEYQILQKLNAIKGRVMVVLNKQDQYIPDERASILSSLQQRLQCEVVATTVAPVPIKVRKHNADGTINEWMEQSAPDIQQLTTQLNQVLANTGQNLIWATTITKANLLKAEAKTALNIVRVSRANPIIEQHQWIAAAAAFANPVPALDILATAAINAQMVMDLGHVYQQKFSLDQARTVAAEMGGLMLKLGLVELSTKAVSTVLKTNAVTYAVGGVIQGVSAAYLTRVAGLALVEYFQAQEVSIETGNPLNLNKLRSSLLQVFQQSQQMATLQGFVTQGVKRLVPEGVHTSL
jgi:hypothetical protein